MQHLFKTNINSDADRQKVEHLLANDARVRSFIIGSNSVVMIRTVKLSERQLKKMITTLGFECKRIG